MHICVKMKLLRLTIQAGEAVLSDNVYHKQINIGHIDLMY